MPTYRKTHTKTLDSYDFNGLPDDFSRVCWLLLPLILDSEGRGIYNLAWIRSKMFPLRENVQLAKIKKSFDCFAEKKMIIVYEANGKEYFYIPSWKIYQTGTEREAKSTLPVPQELVESESRVSQVVVKHAASTYATESVNESESVNKGGMGGDFNNTGRTPYIRIFSAVTGMVGIPGNKPEAFAALDTLMDVHKSEEKVIEFLKPYWEAWRSLKTENGKSYSKTNLVWLTEKAIAEEIPRKNGKSKHTIYDNPPQPSAEEIRKALKGE